MPAEAARERSARQSNAWVESSAHGSSQRWAVEKSAPTLGSASASSRTQTASVDAALYAMAERTTPASESALASAPCGPSLCSISCFKLRVDGADRRRKGSRPPPRAPHMRSAATHRHAHSPTIGPTAIASGGNRSTVAHAGVDPVQTADVPMARRRSWVRRSRTVAAAARRARGDSCSAGRRSVRRIQSSGGLRSHGVRGGSSVSKPGRMSVEAQTAGVSSTAPVGMDHRSGGLRPTNRASCLSGSAFGSSTRPSAMTAPLLDAGRLAAPEDGREGGAARRSWRLVTSTTAAAACSALLHVLACLSTCLNLALSTATSSSNSSSSAAATADQHRKSASSMK
eukprot:scaffold800_cov111-Isochrysis_galbana.AAC.7